MGPTTCRFGGSRPGTPEAQALRTERRAITVQLAVVMSVLVLATVAVGCLMMEADQHADVDRALDLAIRQDTSSGPVGFVWLDDGPGPVRSGLPPGAAPAGEAVTRVAADGRTVTEQRTTDAGQYTVRTARHGGRVVQAWFDRSRHVADLRFMLVRLVIGEVLAVLASIVAGRVLAGRVIRPLHDALTRQRAFVADASHELRAPLTRLHTRAQQMSRRSPVLPEPMCGDLDLMMRDTRELGEVMEDLLLSAQLRSGAPAPHPVDLAELAAAAIDAETVRAQERGLRLALRHDGGPHIVSGVPTALRRVVSALLDNAIGHTPHGGSVEVTLSGDGSRYVELGVHDNGVGFDLDVAGHLFDRFAHGEHGGGPRFGLGLALVREVVTRHHGTVAADGVPGGGATFTVRLPRCA